MAAEAGINQADAKQRAQARFQRIYAELLVEGGVPSQSSQPAGNAKVAAEALRLAQTADTPPNTHKYFSGDPPRLWALAAIDAEGLGGAGPPSSSEKCALELCGDFFLLCTALKRRPSAPTLEDPNFDVEAADRFFNSLSSQAQASSLQALGRLADGLAEQGCGELGSSPALLRSLLPMLSHPALGEPGEESFEVMKKVLTVVGQTHAQKVARETLSKWYSTLPLAALERRVGQVQQFITLSILEAQAETSGAASLESTMEMSKRDGLSRHIRNAFRLLDICWGANEFRRQRRENWRTRRKAQMMRRQGETFDDEATLALPVAQFHNDAINECELILKHDLKQVLEMQYRGLYFSTIEENRRHDFGIAEFPFVLTPVSKVRMLSIESLLMQREEVRNAMTLAVMMRGSANSSPWLVIKVRRSAVIQDALQQIAIHGTPASQLKKPIKVVFDGEEGVDEGGVQKEFFQLLVEELYNEDFGMFERIDESRNFFFNKNSFEANLEFELFGTILGLAIYNQVILDVKFPMAVYKKLMLGPRANLGISDLLDFKPSLAQGLMTLLEHEDASSFEEVFGPLLFVVDYECFGSRVEAELVPEGKDTIVTFDNREDYVQRYCDWIFNTSAERQYGAFRKGFDQCVSDTLFRQLFRPDELELLICGSPELDFKALEGASQYQDGFTAKSDVVKWFWEVVHTLSQDEKKSLLQFCTGCDRAPVGGLGRLAFIVSRGGPDSDLLPSVHTCFNHLLLPDYGSKEKLEKLLRLAIQHSTGFGLM